MHSLSQKKNMKVFELNAQQIAAWKAATSSVVDGYLESSGALGKQLVEAVKKL